jgi:hypothetical protein
MKALLLLSVLAIALCEVATLRHQKRQNSGDKDAVARCCYSRSRKYAAKVHGYFTDQYSPIIDGKVELEERVSNKHATKFWFHTYI